MREIQVPDDLTSNPASAYRRGFRDGKRTHAAEAGRKGGEVKSEAKAEAARRNGLAGGRPRKTRRK